MKNHGDALSARLTVRTILFTLGAAWLAVSPALSMDQVRPLAGVDAAVDQFGVTGRGVIVALLDRGIDWKNADFRNEDGTTRIAYIFDLTDDTGASASGNTYGMGTIYTRQQIDQALTAGPALAVRDAVGHGTTTAGIAAGNGRNNSNYRGVATEATIIAVKITTEGVPAHDAEPAEAPFYDITRIPVALDFVRDKAHELGLPAVMLLNLGSQGGPTDGTSDLARKIDATVGPGIPGLVFVTGAGDEGAVANRAGGNVPASGSVAIQIQKGDASAPLVFDLFYPETDRFDVTVQSPSGVFGPYASPAGNAAADTRQTADFLYYQNGSAQTFNGGQTGKRQIWIRLEGPIGTYTVTLSGATVTTGRFDATLNPSDFYAFPTNRFLTNVAPGSIWDAAAAHNAICPNAYVNKTSWTAIDGFPRSLTGEGDPGEIWKGSSIGPTFDGRLGIDVSAPGPNLVTTYNPTSFFATNVGNLVSNDKGLYGIAGAVSSAAPTVTGIIALMLQANPSLDAAAVKQILQETAKSDSFTGATPNTTWGYGKINALAAVTQANKVPCSAGPQTLCLAGNRFRVLVNWSVPSKHSSGVGTAKALTGDTGYFWFFSSANIELVVKALDARPVNGHFWVFYGALSNVEYTMRVTDTQTGSVKIYHNTSGNLASVADTAAFKGSSANLEEARISAEGVSAEEIETRSAAELYAMYADLTPLALAPMSPTVTSSEPAPMAAQAVCAADATTLCLNEGRFQLRVDWEVPSKSRTGKGMAVPVTSDTGYFWFFSDANVELVIKVLDARPVNGHFWVFYGALSNVKYTITVTDTQTNAVKTYSNPDGNLASVADTKAF